VAILGHLRVVELGEMVAGPYATRLLADLGADVVKVEPPEGDPARRRGPFPGDAPHPDTSGLFLYLHAGKRGVVADRSCAEGAALVRRLVRDADVVLMLEVSDPWGQFNSLSDPHKIHQQVGRKDVRIVNLSLLNTDWYIRQLRDEEPKVPIKLDDRIVDQLGAGAFQVA
jgi:hypothetical protein